MFRRFRLVVVAKLSVLTLFACGENMGPEVSSYDLPNIHTRLTLVPTGMANPLADMRYYNGTYTGTPGTGTVDYIGNGPGTLYRDNQLWPNGACNGEGCGSHPGVDIPIASGQPVYSTYNGRVYKSTDDCGSNGWGGLITIKSDNPHNSGVGDSIYFSYAHLRSRTYSSGSMVQVGDYVPTGTKIGNTGGGSGDYCPGNSTAAHLHFQIDRGDSDAAARSCSRPNGVPWFPSHIGRTVNTVDTDYYVTRCTYNPGPFVVGGYYWTFWQSNFAEYWTAANVSAWGVTSDALWIDGMNDPWIWRGNNNISCTDIGTQYTCSTRITVEADLYNKVGLDIAFGCRDDPLKVYFITKDSTTWSETKSVSVNPPAGGGQFHVNMGGNTQWSGIVTGLRIDPAESCSSGSGDIINFGYITIERSNH